MRSAALRLLSKAFVPYMQRNVSRRSTYLDEGSPWPASGGLAGLERRRIDASSLLQGGGHGSLLVWYVEMKRKSSLKGRSRPMSPDGTERWIGLALLVPDSQPSMQSRCSKSQPGLRGCTSFARNWMSNTVVPVRLSDHKPIYKLIRT